MKRTEASEALLRRAASRLVHENPDVIEALGAHAVAADDYRAVTALRAECGLEQLDAWQAMYREANRNLGKAADRSEAVCAAARAAARLAVYGTAR